MRPLRRIRDNPIVLLAVAVVALVAWIVIDQVTPARRPKPVDQADLQVVAEYGAAHPVHLGMVAPEPAAGANPSSISIAVLPKLKPGMSRVEIERLIGPPTAERIHPVTAADGRLTYRTAYNLAEPDLPMT